MDKDVEDGQHCHLKDPPAHRGATTPPSTQPPRHTATQAPTVSSIIPAAHTEARRTRHAAPQKTPHHEPPRPNRRPLHPKHPMSPRFHRDGLHFEQALGGFATIDPRHAGDTPQSSAYGSNSPQATNKDKPHHHNKHTKTSRTRPTQPPKEHATLALPSNHSGGFATIDPRHAGDTPQRSAYGSNSPTEPKPAPKHPQASPKAAHKICPSDPKQPQAAPTHTTRPTHTKGRRGLSRGAPTRLTAGDTCYLMRVQTTT